MGARIGRGGWGRSLMEVSRCEGWVDEAVLGKGRSVVMEDMLVMPLGPGAVRGDMRLERLRAGEVGSGLAGKGGADTAWPEDGGRLVCVELVLLVCWVGSAVGMLMVAVV